MKRKLRKYKAGDVSPALTGDVSRLRGDVSDVKGNIEGCDLSNADRARGVRVEELLEVVAATRCPEPSPKRSIRLTKDE